MFNYQIKEVYSFDVYPVALLGNNFKNVTILAVMDQETANQHIDTQAMHVQVYPMLPAGTPNRADAYNYLKIKMASGETTIIGAAWVKEDTIQLVETSIITAKIGDVSPSDVARVRACLVQNGFNNVEISIQ